MLFLAACHLLVGRCSATDEKFIPPNLHEAGRMGCYIEASEKDQGNAKVFVQYVNGRVDYSAVIARRTDVKQLFLDCGKWFSDMAEQFPKSKETK